MGWKLTGGVSGVDCDVDAYFKAQRVSMRPMQSLSWLSVGKVSAGLTLVAANAAVFSLRQISGSSLLVLRRFGLGFVCTTGFTAAQQLSWGLLVARAFTVSDTGGAALALTGNNAKMRTSLDTLLSVDCRQSTTAALNAGTKTLDTEYLGVAAAYAAAATPGNLLPPSVNNLLQQDAGDYPLVLGQNEGVNVVNLTTMGAAGVGNLFVNFELAEVTSY